MLTRDLIVESLWQTLCFHMPIKRTDYHQFVYAFTDGPKMFPLYSMDNEFIGNIEESLYDFILSVENPKFNRFKDSVQKDLDKISDLGRKAENDDRKAGKFREIVFNPLVQPETGLTTGDIIEGWGIIL